MSSVRPDWLHKEHFPFTLRALDLPDGTATYIDEGRGPTLLFVHVGMWSFVFRDVITRLRSDFRCVAVDPPGFGSTPDVAASNGGSPVELERLSTVIGEIVDRLDLAGVTLVVHDLGGPVAVAALADPARPDRIARLQGIVPTNTFLWPPDKRALRTMLRLMGSRPMTAIGTATNIVPRLSSGRAGVGRNLDDADRRVFLGPYRHRGPRRRLHLAMRSACRSDELFAVLARATAGPLADLPALTIYGEKNDPFGFQDRMAEIFDDHEGIVVEAGNHFPMMDDPDLFAETLRSWHRRRVAPGLVAGAADGPADVPIDR